MSTYCRSGTILGTRKTKLNNIQICILMEHIFLWLRLLNKYVRKLFHKEISVREKIRASSRDGGYGVGIAI